MIYANVIRNRGEDKATYQDYREAMAVFARAQMLRGAVNENYAVLYQEFIRELEDKGRRGDGEAALYRTASTAMTRRSRRVIVCHSGLKEEQAVPCVDGVAYAGYVYQGCQDYF